MNILQDIFKLLLTIFIFQFAVLLIYIKDCSYCSYSPNLSVYLFGGLLFVLVYIFCTLLASNTYAPKFRQHKTDFWVNLFTLTLCLYIFYYFKDAQGIFGLKMFVQSGYSNVGFIYKIASTILPALLIYLLFHVDKGLFEYFLIFLIIFALLTVTFYFLSKTPVIVLLLLPWILRKKIPKLYLILISAVGLFGWLMVAFIRESIGNEELTIFDAFFDILFRIPNWYEFVLLLEKFDLSTNVTLLNYNEIITMEVFGYTSSGTGLATTFLGTLYIFFGYFAFLIAPIFIIILKSILDVLAKKGGKIACIFFYILLLDYAPFIMDGNPSFLTGTNNYAAFWLLNICLLFFIFLRGFSNENNSMSK